MEPGDVGDCPATQPRATLRETVVLRCIALAEVDDVDDGVREVVGARLLGDVRQLATALGVRHSAGLQRKSRSKKVNSVDDRESRRRDEVLGLPEPGKRCYISTLSGAAVAGPRVTMPKASEKDAPLKTAVYLLDSRLARATERSKGKSGETHAVAYLAVSRLGASVAAPHCHTTPPGTTPNATRCVPHAGWEPAAPHGHAMTWPLHHLPHYHGHTQYICKPADGRAGQGSVGTQTADRTMADRAVPLGLGRIVALY